MHLVYNIFLILNGLKYGSRSRLVGPISRDTLNTMMNNDEVSHSLSGFLTLVSCALTFHWQYVYMTTQCIVLRLLLRGNGTSTKFKEHLPNRHKPSNRRSRQEKEDQSKSLHPNQVRVIYQEQR